MRNNKFIIICFAFTFCIVSSLTICYSAFNTSLSISGDAYVRVDANIRITNLELIDCQNGGYEKFSSNYSKDLTSMSIVLPNTNSSVTYRVTVINKTSKYFTPGEIKPASTYNTNINYIFDGIESYGAYKGDSLTFLIKFTTTLANQELNLTLSYDFKVINETVWDFSYINQSQTFSPLYNATYKIEAWGASGGRVELNPGCGAGGGAYTAGVVKLEHKKDLFVYVGEAGKFNEGVGSTISMPVTYNGGGEGKANGGGSLASGGGATDVRLVSGNWQDFNSLKSRIMVAGGGASGVYYNSNSYKNWNPNTTDGAAAGGLVGYSGTVLYLKDPPSTHNSSYGGSQTNGGTNTYGHTGQFGYAGTTHGSCSGGGGGYYGGEGGYDAGWSPSGGGGGSSFISGHNGCNAIKESSTASNIIHTGDSKHYSNYVFSNTIMIDGKGCKWTNELTSDCSGQTQPDGSVTLGHFGDGYVRITLIPSN